MSTPNRISFRSCRANALSITALIFLWFTSQAQPFVLTNGGLLATVPYFDQEWIAKLHISQVHATVSVKDDGLPIRKTRTTFTYRFKPTGQFVWMKHTIDKGGWIDSASTAIRYNDIEQIIFKRERDLFGIHLYTYEYRADGTPFREVYTRPAAYKMKPKSVFFEDQIFEGGTVKRIHRNVNDRAFKDEIFRYMDDNKPESYREKRHITGLYQEKYWHYTDQQLDSLTHILHQPNKTVLSYHYMYDDSGSLIATNEYKNGTLVAHTELLYANGILDATLRRDEATHRITITRFSYDYF